MQLCDSKYISVNQFGFDKWFSNLTLSTRPQIGNRFALTAAHCLYSDDMEEVLPATSFSIVLGLHDRRKAKEPNRWLFCFTKGSLVCMYLSDMYMGSDRWVFMAMFSYQEANQGEQAFYP